MLKYFQFLVYLLVVSAAFTQNSEGKFFDIPNAVNRELGEMAMDDEGFIWFITNQGLCRYDGNDAKLIEYSKLQLPVNSSPNHLFCYKEYIICSQASKLYLFNKISRLSKTFELNSWVSKMYADKNGDAVFVTYSGQIWKFSKKTGLQKGLDFASIAGFKKPTDLMHASVDANGHLFLFLTNDQFGAYDGSTIKWSPVAYFEKLGGKSVERYIRMSAVTGKYVGILFDNGDVHIYDKHTLLPVSKILKKSIAALLSIDDELLVIPSEALPEDAIPSSEVFRIVGNFFKEQTRISGTIIVKKEWRKILLSTNNGLIELSASGKEQAAEIRQKKIVAFFKNKSIRSIYKRGDELLIGTYSGLYNCINDSIYLVNKMIAYTIQPKGKDELLLGLEGASGLATYNTINKQFQLMPNAWFKNKHFHVTALSNDNGQWICGSFNQISAIFDSSNTFGLKPMHVSTGQLGIVRQISKIREQLFVACQDGVFKFIGNNLKKLYPTNSSIRVSAMLEVNDGIWLGTHGDGLVKINDEGKVLQRVGFNEGLINNFVYSIVASDKKMIIGTGNGVSLLTISDKPHPIQIQNDADLNGSFSQEFNHSAYFLDQEGKQAILGGIRGLAFSSDKDNAIQASTNVKLSYIKITGSNATYQLDLFAGLRDTIKIPSVSSSINLKFTSINDPENEFALFRINGLSDQWQNIKLLDEVNIYSLPPGEYSIEVKLPYSENPKEWFTKKLIVTPVFYQTLLFKTFLVLILLGSLYLYWRSRNNKLKREFKMRSLIASDLHDDIGSTLNSISVYSAIAEQQYETNTPNTKQLLDKIGIASREMVDKMSDIVWAIHPKNDSFSEVLDRIRFFAAELLSTKNIQFEFIVDEHIHNLRLGMEKRKNIYLICKEGVNNAYKYAEASCISVQFNMHNKILVIEIKDNGKGFDLEHTRAGGNGLFNMKNRAGEMGAVVDIESSRATGTKLKLTLPL